MNQSVPYQDRSSDMLHSAHLTFLHTEWDGTGDSFKNYALYNDTTGLPWSRSDHEGSAHLAGALLAYMNTNHTDLSADCRTAAKAAYLALEAQAASRRPTSKRTARNRQLLEQHQRYQQIKLRPTVHALGPAEAGDNPQYPMTAGRLDNPGPCDSTAFDSIPTFAVQSNVPVNWNDAQDRECAQSPVTFEGDHSAEYPADPCLTANVRSFFNDDLSPLPCQELLGPVPQGTHYNENTAVAYRPIKIGNAHSAPDSMPASGLGSLVNQWI